MPPRNPRPCTAWPCNEMRPCSIHDRPGVAERDRNSRRVESRRVYNSARWKRLRARILRDTPWCPVEGCTNPTSEVDHTLPIEDGGDPWDEDNLRPLCRPHHSRKTAEDVKARRAGRARRNPEPSQRVTRRRRREGGSASRETGTPKTAGESDAHRREIPSPSETATERSEDR